MIKAIVLSLLVNGQVIDNRISGTCTCLFENPTGIEECSISSKEKRVSVFRSIPGATRIPLERQVKITCLPM